MKFTRVNCSFKKQKSLNNVELENSYPWQVPENKSLKLDMKFIQTAFAEEKNTDMLGIIIEIARHILPMLAMVQ